MKSGETLNKAGNLALIVTNEKGKTDIAEFTIIDIAEFTIISEYKNIKLNNIQPSEILPII